MLNYVFHVCFFSQEIFSSDDKQEIDNLFALAQNYKTLNFIGMWHNQNNFFSFR